MLDDGVALTSTAHPRPVWYKRIWFWITNLFGSRVSKDSIEKIEISVRERDQ